MKIVSWNVNGLRSVIKKNALDQIFKEDPDIICLQETRCPKDLDWMQYIPSTYKYNLIVPSSKAGYAGVGLVSKWKPQRILHTDDILEQGRCICAEFKTFYVVNLYVPNSKSDLSALSRRTTVWEPGVRNLIKDLSKTKPIIVVADFNVAPAEIDIYMKKKPTDHGATPTERNDFQKLLNECKLIDTYRELNPKTKEWTWFSNFGKAREHNHGWRIDMALVSESIKSKVVESSILGHVQGSDHIPISITLKP